MNYQRLLVLTTVDGDPQPAFSTIRRFLPAVTRMIVIAQEPAQQLAWLTPVAPPDLHDAANRALDELREAANPIAPSVEVALTPDLTADALTGAVIAASIDLVVIGSLPLRSVALAAELRKRTSVPVLCVRSAPAMRDSSRGNRLLCVGVSVRARRSITTFLRDHAGPGDEAVDRPDQREIDLVVLPRCPPPVFLGVGSGPPVPILPPMRPPVAERERAIDIPDLVDDGAVIRVRLEYAIGIGRRTPTTDQPVAFEREGQIVARATLAGGEAELPSGIGDSVGVFRTYGREAPDPAARVEGRVAILRAGQRPVILFDVEIAPEHVPIIRSVTWADAVGVRLRSTRSCSSLRARLRAAGLQSHVIDAGAVLGEGDAQDVPALADGVRLARTAARMRADGFPVAAIVYQGPHQPAARGFNALPVEELPALASSPAAASRRVSVADRLDATTGSDAMDGNNIEVELDNSKARSWLLSAISGSRRRVHFQVYMALDDDVGHEVEAALAAAGARGVTVRVLVDSLHGLHGSFGARNPILERLSSRPGVELRVSKPITGPPTLEDLKQRDHRKLTVVDGRVALLGGRNLSHEYYSGFDEVPLTAETTWRMVPWLDAGARVEGPAVAALERSFLQAWTDAGGGVFDIPDMPAAGPARARVVVHRGLRDAHTLEAYLALIETARSHIYVVNGFPLQLEIQHALLRALGRGVRVRTLFGNLTPRHGNTIFAGPWAAARTAATAFVHSRMDALVAAGGECYEFVVPNQRGWDRTLGDVRPHVHAKTMSADGRVCTVGSANLDITAGYWESELLLVVEDEGIARGVEARYDELMAASSCVDRDDPEWRRRAELRQWMRHWPGVMSI